MGVLYVVLLILGTTGITVHTHISVTSLPDLLFSEHKSIVEGSVLWLYCEVSSISYTMSVTWNKDEGQLVQDVPHICLRTSNTSSSTTLLLVIDNVVSSDAGVYQCTARDGQDYVRGESLTMTVLSSRTPGMLRIIFQDPLTTGLHANRTGTHSGHNISLSYTAGHVGDNEMNYSISAVQWLKDGNPSTLVPTDALVGTNGQLRSNLSFTFTTSDAGVYQCIFIDSNSQIYGSIPLRIDTGNVTIPTRVSPQIVFHTVPNKLVLEVSGEGEYCNIVWNRGGETLGASSLAPAELSEFVKFFEIFVREPTSTSDQGLYEIFYSGAGGLGTTIAVVSPVLPNTTTEQVEKLSILEGGNIAISCCSIGGPVPVITWTLNNHNTEFNQTDIINEASLSSTDYVTIGNIISTLHIADSQYPTHDGVYTCTGRNTASDSHNTSSVNISLMIKVIPEVRLDVILNNNTGHKTVILICNIVRGNPMDYSYEWTFNGTELNSNNSHLILTNITIEQTGTYFCSVTNEVGTGTGNATLVYIGIRNGTVTSEKEIMETKNYIHEILAVSLVSSLVVILVTATVITSILTLIIKKKMKRHPQKKADNIHEYDCIDSAKKEMSQYNEEIALESDINFTICDAYGQLPINNDVLAQ